MKKILIISLIVAVLTISVILIVLSTKFAFGFGAVLILISTSLKREKDLHDSRKNKRTWKKFFNEKWDDYLLSWGACIALVSIQHFVFIVVNFYYKNEYTELYDIAGQYLVSAFLGWFGDRLVERFYTKRDTIINKLQSKL